MGAVELGSSVGNLCGYESGARREAPRANRPCRLQRSRINFIDPDDKEFKETIQNIRKSWNCYGSSQQLNVQLQQFLETLETILRTARIELEEQL